MASEGIGHLILFIGAIIVAGGVAVTLIGIADDVSVSVEAVSDDLTTQLENDVTIISDPGSDEAIYDDDTDEITLLVMNTGENTLEEDNIIVLVNGEIIEVDQAEIVGDAEQWREGEVVRVTVTEDIDTPAEHRFVVRVDSTEDTSEVFIE